MEGIHPHTIVRGIHSGGQPAQHEQLELDVLLKDAITDSFSPGGPGLEPATYRFLGEDSTI